MWRTAVPHPLTRRDLLSATVGAAAAMPLLCSNADDKKPRIKIGQIGVGHAHATKLAVFRESPDYEVVGVVEPDKELRERAGQQPAFRDLPWMTEEQLLNISCLSAVESRYRTRVSRRR